MRTHKRRGDPPRAPRKRDPPPRKDPWGWTPNIADGTPVQPHTVEGVQKVVGSGSLPENRVGTSGGGVVGSGSPQGGSPSGSPAGGYPPATEKKVVTPKQFPPEKEEVPPPLVPESGPPPPKKEPTLKEGITEELSPAELSR